MKTKKIQSLFMSIIIFTGLLQGDMVLAADNKTDILAMGDTDYFIMDTTSENFDEPIYTKMAGSESCDLTTTEYSLWVGGEQFTSDRLTINGTTGTAIYNPDNNTLTLSDYSYTGEGYEYNSETGLSAVIYSKDDFSIVLKGNNSLTNTSEAGDGVAFGKNLTISGDGTLVICSDYGIYSKEGNVTINGGTLDIVSDDYSIYTYGVTIESGTVQISGDLHGIYAASSVNIKGGTVDITGGNYGIFSYSVTIEGGIAEITGDYVIGAYQLTVSDAMAIILPTNGKVGINDIGYEFMTILHETGKTATCALLAPKKDHNWSKDFTISNTHHWHSCTDTDCFINDYPEVCDGYEAHRIDSECENDICSGCNPIGPAINRNGVSGSKATATVTIQEKGTYAVIFADYEGGRLNALDIVTVTVTEDKVGIITIPSEKDITLGTDDKIMLWSDLANIVPKCEAYIVD